ncbi:alpha/beta fold hydrolase [Streptomyces sp. NPDC050161]|uniref:alpha/beta fold hydrolase n=1 Tax=Streptomyces sp. NPDC050161 TaxID=3365604 RepID=UPI0037A299FA
MTDLSPTHTVFVFVHGAWHGSWQWAATQRALAGLGAAGLAVDLPGHGFDALLPSGYLLPGQPGLLTEKSPLANVTMDDCAESVLDTLRQVRRHRRVVLVAHSAGGGPASLAAERAPELVDALVYLSASSPPDGRGSPTTSARPRTPRRGDGVSTSATPRSWVPYGSTRSHRIPPTSRICGRPTTTTPRRAASTAGARR